MYKFLVSICRRGKARYCQTEVGAPVDEDGRPVVELFSVFSLVKNVLFVFAGEAGLVTARPRLALRSMKTGDLPPHSSVTGVRWRAAALITTLSGKKKKPERPSGLV